MNDVPEVLKERGTALWKAVMGDLEGDVHDEALVLETCRTLDVIDALAAAVESEGVTVTGSRGQVIVNPAVAEMRQQQTSFARLLGQLNLDAAEVGAMLSARQAAAKRAGQARWRAQAGARNGVA